MVIGKNDRRAEDNNVDQDLTDRLLMSLVFDVTQLADETEQLKVLVYGIVRQRGLVKSESSEDK